MLESGTLPGARPPVYRCRGVAREARLDIPVRGDTLEGVSTARPDHSPPSEETFSSANGADGPESTHVDSGGREGSGSSADAGDTRGPRSDGNANRTGEQGPRAANGSHLPVWAWLAPIVLVVLAWSGSVTSGGFSYDDREIVQDNPVVRGTTSAWHAFDRDYWHHRGDAGHWRPTATLTLRMDHALHGMEPAGYHRTNLLLHLLVVALAALALRSAGAGLPELLGLALFAVHPALADSVAWISGRTSMLSAIGGLLGIVLVQRARGHAGLIALASAFGLLLGLAGKEDAIVFAILLPLVASVFGRRAIVGSTVGVAVALGLWLCARDFALGAALPSSPEAPLAATSLPGRMAVGGRAIVEAARLVAFPIDHPPGYRLDAFQSTPADATVRAYLGWILWFSLAGFGLLRLITGPHIAGWSAFAMAAAWLPMSQLVPSGEILAPRFLYLPLLFGIPLIGGALRHLPGPAIGILLVGCLPLAWARSEVYADRASYWESRLVHETHRPETWNAVGNARHEKGDLVGAERAWTRGTALDPDYSRNWVGLGRLALDAGDDDAAEDHFLQAVEVGPKNRVAHQNLGAFYVNNGRAYEAVSLLETAIVLAPGATQSWKTLGAAHAAAGKEAADFGEVERAAMHRARAIEVFTEVLRREPTDAHTARRLEALRTP